MKQYRIDQICLDFTDDTVTPSGLVVGMVGGYHGHLKGHHVDPEGRGHVLFTGADGVKYDLIVDDVSFDRVVIALEWFRTCRAQNAVYGNFKE